MKTNIHKNRIQLKKFQINQDLIKQKQIKSGLVMSTSTSSLKSNNYKEKKSLSKQKSSHKISINNINVNTNNLNLNTSFNMNLNLYKRVNTMVNSPRSTSNISNNSNGNFDKNVVNELRNQFLEITKKKKSNLNESNSSSLNNSLLNLENSQKNIQFVHKFRSNEKKSKPKMGNKSLNLFDSLKNNFLNPNANKINFKSREKLKKKPLITKTEYCETENLSTTDVNFLNHTNTLDQTRNIRIETNPNTNTNTNITNESLHINLSKYNNEINENKKLKKQNEELRRWINVLKSVIISQNNNFIKKFNDREVYHINREKALIKENNSLKKIIISSFEAIKIFDKISFEYEDKLNKTYSQILTENQYLRKIFLNNTKESETKNFQYIHKRINNFVKNNFYHNNNRNTTKIKIDRKEENQDKKSHYVNTITHFGNSHAYLNQTMKKEMMNNLYYSNIKSKQIPKSNSTNNINQNSNPNKKIKNQK